MTRAIPGEGEGFTPGGRWALLVLFLTNVVGYQDRQIIALLVQPIKKALRLSDGEIGLMQGAAFVATFSLSSLLIGRLIDRRNRRNLLIICVSVWTLAAASGGLAQHGWQLFLARMGVGIGEAALVPTAVSLIGDYFTQTRRGFAQGLFTSGVYVGTGLSLVVVGALLPAISLWCASLSDAGTHIEPWRIVMLSTLVPGAVCCGLLATIREPLRGSVASASNPLDWSGIRDWLDRARLFVPHHLAMGCATLGGYAITAWFPTLLIRQYGYDTKHAGAAYGVLIAVVGVLSVWGGSALSDLGMKRRGIPGRLFIALLCLGIAFAGFCLIWQARNDVPLLIGATLVTAGLGVTMVIGNISQADIAPPRSRGQIASIYFTWTGIMGAAGGPAAVGYANDLLGSDKHSLGAILGEIGITACLASAALTLLTIARINRGLVPGGLPAPALEGEGAVPPF